MRHELVRRVAGVIAAAVLTSAAVAARPAGAQAGVTEAWAPSISSDGRWVVFGLGNQLSGMGDATGCCGVRALDGLMVRVEVVEQPDGSFTVERPEAIPTFLGRSPYRIVPVRDALADPALAGHVTADELRASLERTATVVDQHLRP